jgi:hypothetical protein
MLSCCVFFGPSGLFAVMPMLPLQQDYIALHTAFQGGVPHTPSGIALPRFCTAGTEAPWHASV